MKSEDKVKDANITNHPSTQLRVFISYSRDDEKYVKVIEKVLLDNGLTPLRDKAFTGGTGFQEQIKTFISHAHVFLPFITKESSTRGWVHQEIGYASGQNVPVLPVTIDADPSGIIQEIQAIKLDKDNLENDAKKRLTHELFTYITERAMMYDRPPLYECAPNNETRAQMLAQYSYQIRILGNEGVGDSCVRQSGGLTSFHIPRDHVENPKWKTRYLRSTIPCVEKSQMPMPDGCSDIISSTSSREKLRYERIALEHHARNSGCKLIIDLDIHAFLRPEARICRIQELISFLENEPYCQRYEAVIGDDMHAGHSLTIVGDYFLAEAVSGTRSKGYKQTIFTRHAATIGSRIEKFDEEFNRLKANRSRDECKHDVIEALKNKIRELS